MSAMQTIELKEKSCQISKEYVSLRKKVLKDSMYAHAVSAQGWLKKQFNEK